MSLKVRIKKKFKGFLLNVNFEACCDNGEYLGLLGSSGSGKSMTLKCIAGVETPDEGYIELNGRVVFDSNKKINIKPQERNVGYLFQNYALFPHMTAEENIGIGLKLSKKEKKYKLNELIKTFKLEGLEKKYPFQLSGGQQQRVALARILAYEPDVLLLDEPFSALDTYLKEKLQNEILDFLLTYHGMVIMVTHSRDEVYKFCKNLCIIDNGKMILTGKTKDIFKQPKLLKVAKLIGCKNFSSCEILSSNSIYAIDWNLKLKLENSLTDNYDYISVREHTFKISDEDEFKMGENIIECKIIKVIEEVFEYIIVFENINNKKNKVLIWYKTKKDEWDKRKDKDRLYLRIPEEAILLIKNSN
ncbi:MAG: ATP-binding cassette domain-containing protein [Tissierellia bacterium]|nr:ATP-binding cassette domain-containing protein [Tissierellia bacterium]